MNIPAPGEPLPDRPTTSNPPPPASTATPPGRAVGSFEVLSRLARLGRLTRKELRESLRDRRTLATLVLMPLLVYPLLSFAFQQYLMTGLRSLPRTEYQLGLVGSDTTDQFLMRYLLAAGTPAEPAENPQKPGEPPKILGLPDGPGEDPVAFICVKPNDPDQALRDRECDVLIRAAAGDLSEPALDRPVALDVDLVYLDGSSHSLRAAQELERLLTAANGRHLYRLLHRANSDQRPEPVTVRRTALASPDSAEGVSLAAIVPLILILMTITGAVYPAIDLTAGERERGTLEVLVAAPVSRLEVLFAKYAAVLTVAMLTAVINLGMMTTTLLRTGLGPLVFGPRGATPGLAAEVLGLLFLFTAFFAAVLLAVTSVARSFKEAQAYLIPLMLMALAPGLLSILPGLKLSGGLAVAPLINIVLLARDLIEGTATPGLTALVVVSTPLYALLALAVAARLFGAEAVLYSDQGTWAEVFRRPASPQPAAGPTAAALCAALLFPGHFLATGVVAQVGGGDLTDARVLLLGLVTVGLFGGVPAVLGYFGRVRLGSGYMLRRPGVAAVIGGVVVGVSLWPLLQLGLTGLRQVGLGAIPADQSDRIAALMRQLRAVSPAAVVLSLGVLPGIFEELCFRGFLFAALKARTGARTTVVASAVLFGLFHLVFAESLAVERFLSSTTLGLVLGGCCWRTGSVVPGMLLHVCHNTSLLVLALTQGGPAGGVGSADELFPAWWYLAAAVGVTAGGALVWAGGTAAARGREPFPSET